jgi:hypothetical protein
MVLKAMEDARERIEENSFGRNNAFVKNFHPTAWKTVPDIVGHQRPDDLEGEILRSAPYALGGDDYSSQTRDYKGASVSFKNPSGEWVHPED